MNWYLRKGDGGVYGPVDIDTLRRWAAEGRVSPEDSLSADQSRWAPAPELPELEMTWLIDIEGGDQYGPIHLLAIRELLADGSLTPQTRVIHKRTGAVRALSELLSEQAPAPVAAAVAPTPAGPDPKAVSAAGPAAPVAQPKQVWKEIAERRDFFEREMKKWRKMYEDERDNAHRREEAANARIEDYRKNDLNNRTHIEQLERKLVQLERNYNLMKQAAEAGTGDPNSAQAMALTESYEQLSEQYDSLMQQLTNKSAEIQGLLESRAQIEKSSEEQVKRAEEITRREREEADKARQHLAEMEETHLHLVKAYRELNERFIRRRDQNAMPSGPRTPAAAAPAPQPADGDAAGRSKVRLNRR